MTSNYKIIVDKYKGEEFFQIHEVYYDDNGDPNGYTENAITVFSEEGVQGITEQMKIMKRALKEPVIWGGSRFPQEYVK